MQAEIKDWQVRACNHETGEDYLAVMETEQLAKLRLYNMQKSGDRDAWLINPAGAKLYLEDLKLPQYEKNIRLTNLHREVRQRMGVPTSTDEILRITVCAYDTSHTAARTLVEDVITKDREGEFVLEFLSLQTGLGRDSTGRLAACMAGIHASPKHLAEAVGRNYGLWLCYE